MGKFVDLTGQRFGELTVESYAGKRKWNVACSCGNHKQVLGYNMQSGATQSCGCLGRKHRRESLTKHGMYGSRLYYVWINIIKRCTNPHSKNFKYYGGRGITICDDWRDNFQAFYDWAIANGYNENAHYGECTIDRIDVNGNYCPANCRWVSMAVQNKNKRDTFTDKSEAERRLAELRGEQ